MTTANDEVTAIIANALAKSDDALSKVVDYTRTAQTVAQGFTSFNPNNIVIPEAFSVPPFVPNQNLATQYGADFDLIWSDMEGWTKELMANYVDSHFPVSDPAIETSQNVWLLDVVNNGYLGIPVNIEIAMWDRARSKDTLEATRMEEEASSQMSARGFSAPPGVLFGRLQLVQQEAANKSSTIARDLAIKQTEISIDMTKFAVQEMTKLRLGIAAALADYLRAWMTLPAAAAEIAKAKAELSRTLWDSSANYIQALVSKANLKLEADKSNLNAKVTLDKISVDNFLGSQKLRVDTAVSAADALGKVAAAYANSMNTLGHIGDITNTTA